MIGGNPALSENTFGRYLESDAAEQRDAMTVQGAVYKTMALLAICVATAVFSWGQAVAGSGLTMPLLWGGLIGGLIVALITIFKAQWSPVTAPIYAALEGLFLGAISAFFAMSFDDPQQTGGFPVDSIVVQAIGLTMGVAASMLILYSFRIITVTAKLRAGIMMATGAVFLVYIASMVMGLFGIEMPYLHSSGPIGIGISLVIVAIAAFNLLLDFDLIERGAEQGAPKYMEWYGAFALMVTLVWLYLEILRLLSKLRER